MKYVIPLLVLIVFSCESRTEKTTVREPEPFSKTYINPHNGYSEAVAVQTGNLKTIYISGQVGEGEDFEAQFRDALGKLFKMLEASGVTFDDVVKYNTYIVDYTPEYLPIFRKVRKELLGDSDMPASTLVGVDALGLEAWGVEIEAVAVIQN
ncbi:RidA family protein [Flagellimonas allohymeniacidonis]|uniref:RidA family protein n=1 Tax=Flagellimonas allohymeniacidonis TaxID=2517819 RepID=A0A4Q8QD32_9FLAO|nr:RidA family protein [Allomuricauda hymeniacidonis]TAI47417.1 RidA family protein [Allomuricauda hymeniacidonis]